MRQASRPIHSLLSVGILAAAAAACGSDNGTGFFASGSLDLAVTTGADGATTATGFSFPQHTRIDPTLPPGATTGYTGTCSLGPNGRTVHVVGVGTNAHGLREFTLTLPDWSQDDCAACAHGQLDLVVGDATFRGTDTRGAAASPCAFTAQRHGSYGMTVGIQCAGLAPAAATDARRAEATGDLLFEQCDGLDSRN